MRLCAHTPKKKAKNKPQQKKRSELELKMKRSSTWALAGFWVSVKAKSLMGAARGLLHAKKKKLKMKKISDRSLPTRYCCCRCLFFFPASKPHSALGLRRCAVAFNNCY